VGEDALIFWAEELAEQKIEQNQALDSPEILKFVGSLKLTWAVDRVKWTWQFGKIGSQIAIWQSGLENWAKELSK
jgi:hypothetical protein